VFTTGGSENPTLTIVTSRFRQADYIAGAAGEAARCRRAGQPFLTASEAVNATSRMESHGLAGLREV